MAEGFAAGVVNSFLDTTFGTTWVKLHTANPGAAGASAAAAGDTTRKQATMASASGGVKSMTGSAGPWTNGGTSEDLAFISLWTASTSGTFNASVQLTTPKSWEVDDTFTLTSLSISITPIAS